MAININTVIENLNELLTNSVNLTDKYYDLFINPEPMMVDLELYNEDNQLVTVTVPNRAKDRENFGSIIDEVHALANVASTGEYFDLKDAPNGTLTIKQNNSTIATFNIGSNTDVTANVNIPSHALKSYLDEGELLTDPEGLADVLYYYHSTFDESKFTINGSPTITDGVVSNFSATNHITLTTNYSATTALKFSLKFTTPASLSTNQPIVALRNSDNTNYIDMWIFNGGLQLRAYTSANVNKQFTISANTTYYAQIEYSGGSWTGRISTDGINWTQQTLGIADILSPIVNTSIGRYTGTTYEGSVDLKYFSIYTNNVPVFTGNKTGRDVVSTGEISETITYNISKTGSKIADSYYRYRIKNIYNYVGYAPYYTVSDTNFTLPQGEIYGLMENKAEEKAEEYNGQWVYKILALVEGQNTNSTNQYEEYEFAVDSYLPDDCYNYEVIIEARCTAGDTIGDEAHIFVNTDIIGYPNPDDYFSGIKLCDIQTVAVTAFKAYDCGNTILPVGLNRKILFRIKITGADGEFSLYLKGYRRIGKK